MGSNAIIRNLPIPLHYQLKQLILEKIKDGTYPVGQYIPTEFDLMEEYGVSRTTIRQAIMALVNEGYLTRERAKGTIVNPPRLEERFIQVLAPYYNEDMRARGFEPRNEILKFCTIGKGEIVSNPDLVDAGDFKEKDKLFYIKRLRYTDDIPQQITEDYFHEDCEILTRLTPEEIKENGISKSMAADQDPKTKAVRVVRKIWAMMPSRDEAELLQIGSKVAVQCIKTYSYNAADELVRFTIAKFRGDRNEFVIELHETR